NKKGETLLNYAIKKNNIELVKYLIEHGANSNKKNKQGITPLICAIKKIDRSHSESFKKAVIHMLVEHGADINNHGGKGGKTPLIYAIVYENEDIVKYLIENGSNINKSDFNGKLPLDYAIESQNKNIMKYLV
ncbi:ankyrin, partial [Anaeromyces robustus]